MKEEEFREKLCIELGIENYSKFTLKYFAELRKNETRKSIWKSN